MFYFLSNILIKTSLLFTHTIRGYCTYLKKTYRPIDISDILYIPHIFWVHFAEGGLVKIYFLPTMYYISLILKKVYQHLHAAINLYYKIFSKILLQFLPGPLLQTLNIQTYSNIY